MFISWLTISALCFLALFCFFLKYFNIDQIFLLEEGRALIAWILALLLLLFILCNIKKLNVRLYGDHSVALVEKVEDTNWDSFPCFPYCLDIWQNKVFEANTRGKCLRS